MKTSVKDKASYFDEIIFLLYVFYTVAKIYIYTQFFCLKCPRNNWVNEWKTQKNTFFSLNVILQIYIIFATRLKIFIFTINIKYYAIVLYFSTSHNRNKSLLLLYLLYKIYINILNIIVACYIFETNIRELILKQSYFKLNYHNFFFLQFINCNDYYI